MRIRKMTVQDTEAVAAIEKTIFSCPWSAQGFCDSLLNADTLFLVALTDADTAKDAHLDDHAALNGRGTPEIAGYIGMYLSLDEGEITNVAVAEPHRKKGVASALIRELVSEAEKRGILRIVLEVRVSNLPAIALYERMGFCRIGTRRGFYDFPKEDADIMELWIRRPNV